MDNDMIVLKNLKNIVLNNIVSESDYHDMLQVILTLIDDLINTQPILWAKPNSEDLIIEEITELLFIQFENIIPSFIDDKHHIKDLMEDTISRCIQDAFYMYYSFFSPKRSYPNTFVRFVPREKNKAKYIEKMRKKVDYLSSVPQPDQRTEEWYIFRHKHLTASSIWKVFSTECSRNQLIYDKCKPIDTSKYMSVSTETPMHWGHKYEPLSIMWYEKKFSTIVSDFGCIPHDKIPYLAASPDGINTCPESPRFGRMVEVKNIVNRDITGIPKLEYWIQMQFQMEVCKLNECDFLETRFHEYETKEDFDNDGTFTQTRDGKEKGIILYFIKDGQPHYEYAPFMCSQQEFLEWEKETMKKYNELTWMKNIYWKLQEISCVLVLRNKNWFQSTLPILEEFWNIIEREKQTGYEHRAPKKKMKTMATPPLVASKCIINMETLDLNNLSKSTAEKEIQHSEKSSHTECVIVNDNKESNKESNKASNKESNKALNKESNKAEQNIKIINIETPIFSPSTD